jgi:hypothetical protein
MKVFCELAHGSPIRNVSDFSNPKEFHQKIARCFDISVQDILFCTINTRDADMSRLLSDWPNPGDLIYVHCKGQSSVTSIYLKDLSIVISAQIFGNNFIRSTTTKKGKSASRIPNIEEGDHIQMINGENVVGFRNIGVIEMLKKIPMDSVLVLSLVKPRKVGDMLLDICVSNQQEEETLDLLPFMNFLRKDNRGGSSDYEHSEREDDMNDEDIEAGDDPFDEDSEEDDYGNLSEDPTPLMSSLDNTIVDIEPFLEFGPGILEDCVYEYSTADLLSIERSQSNLAHDNNNGDQLNRLKRIEARLENMEKLLTENSLATNCAVHQPTTSQKHNSLVLEKVTQLEAQCNRLEVKFEQLCGRLEAQNYRLEAKFDQLCGQRSTE